jgi:hypothetical protein
MVSPRTSQIYVSLLDEGTDVWRPVAAEHIRDDIYRIVGEIPGRRRLNQSMKPTAPSRYKFSVFATTPCRGLSQSR